MARHARQVEQQGEACHTLHQGANCGTAKAQDEVPFPVARHGAISGFRRTLADHDLGRDEALASLARARPRHPQRPPGAQTGRQLAAQRTATLNEQRLIDGFVAELPLDFMATESPRFGARQYATNRNTGGKHRFTGYLIPHKGGTPAGFEKGLAIEAPEEFD